MMRRIAVVVGLFVAASGALAADLLEQRIAELMVRSGIDKQANAYPDMVRLGMQQGRAQFPIADAQYQALLDAVATAFDPTAMKLTISRRLRKDLGLADIDGALAWLDSPLGRKATQLEEQYSTAEAYVEGQAWAKGLKQPLPAERIQLIARFDRALGLTEFGVASLKHSQLAMVAAMTATQTPEQQRQALDKVTQVFESKHDDLIQKVGQQTLPHMVYTYRSLSDAELEQYIAYAVSPNGKRYHTATMAALEEAIVRASHEAGAVFSKALRNPKRDA